MHVEDWSAHGTAVLVDESFLDFVKGGEQESAMPTALTRPNVLVLRSATKIFAMPGLRFGFGVGEPSTIGSIDAARDGWSVNQLAQVAAQAAYQDAEFLQSTWAWLQPERIFVRKAWQRQRAVRVWPSSVNFVLLQFDHESNARRVDQSLRQQGMHLRDCSDFRGLGPAYRRIAIRSHAENALLAMRCSRLLDGEE